MDIPIVGAMTRAARDKLRAPALVAAALFFGVGGTIPPAAADKGDLYVAPGPSSLVATSHATDLVVTTKCGHYLYASISYADGTVKTLNLGNAAASQSDMDKAKAAIPILRIVEEFGCDH